MAVLVLHGKWDWKVRRLVKDTANSVIDTKWLKVSHLDCDLYQKLLFSVSIYRVSAINVAKIMRCLAYKNWLHTQTRPSTLSAAAVRGWRLCRSIVLLYSYVILFVSLRTNILGRHGSRRLKEYCFFCSLPVLLIYFHRRWWEFGVVHGVLKRWMDDWVMRLLWKWLYIDWLSASGRCRLR